MTQGRDDSELLDMEAPAADAPQVFVSDASAEAEGLARSLRHAGYLVADVPLSMLYSRVAVQRPHVILLDADSEGAFDCVRRIRTLPEATLIDVLFLGRTGETLAGPHEAFERGGGGFFARPVDVPMLLSKIELLTGGPPRGAGPRPMPSIPAPRPSAAHLPSPSMRTSDAPPRPAPHVPSARPSRPAPASVNPEEERAGRSSMPSLGPLSAPSLRDAGTLSRPLGLQGPLSPELERLLGDAEDRELGLDEPKRQSNVPTPDEEIEMVLPAEVLASLDEPLDDDTEDESDPGLGRGTVRPNTARRALSDVPYGRSPETNAGGGTGAGTGATSGTGAGSSSAVESRPRASSVPPRPTLQPPRTEHSGVRKPLARLIGASVPPPPLRPAIATGVGTGAGTGTGTGVGARSASGTGGGTSPGASAFRSFEGDGDAVRTLAFAVASRQTGCLVFSQDRILRRIVLRDGDFITAASTLEDETLLAFLVARGDVPKSAADRHAGKVSGFGKHAGAALVAHGLLSQEQLWPALRAHAEWLVIACALLSNGTIGREEEPPGRLKSEPSVFGGSTGAEVFVELVRRLFAPEAAITALGGPDTRFTEGAAQSLLRECALSTEEERLVVEARASTLGEVVARSAEPEFACVLYALSLLGVLDVLRGTSAPRTDVGRAGDVEKVLLVEEDAIRERIRARMDLVEEGDYFAILGVPKNATSYEIKRAYVELRRTFEPTRLLTPQLTALLSDVTKIVNVLEEAYEVLRDSARRERYRRAIDAGPPAP